MSDSPSGLLLLHKPVGVTSFDCVAVVRKKIGVKRVGHCGTLDPMARGLLLTLVGPSTRAQDSFLSLQKQYWFQAELGRQTTTGDLEGEVNDVRPWDHVTQESLRTTFNSFVGQIEQTPPLYSALKHKGKPYYYYARKGQDVPRVPRETTIYSLSLLSFAPPSWQGRVACSRGTYIRTLVEDIAKRLQCCATLVELVRERIGPYRLEDALTWQDLKDMDSHQLISRLHPVDFTKVSINA